MLDSFFDELEKISQAQIPAGAAGVLQGGGDLLKKYWKQMGLLGAGMGGMHVGSQAVGDLKRGRMYRQAMEKQRGG